MHTGSLRLRRIYRGIVLFVICGIPVVRRSNNDVVTKVMCRAAMAAKNNEVEAKNLTMYLDHPLSKCMQALMLQHNCMFI